MVDGWRRPARASRLRDRDRRGPRGRPRTLAGGLHRSASARRQRGRRDCGRALRSGRLLRFAGVPPAGHDRPARRLEPARRARSLRVATRAVSPGRPHRALPEGGLGAVVLAVRARRQLRGGQVAAAAGAARGVARDASTPARPAGRVASRRGPRGRGLRAQPREPEAGDLGLRGRLAGELAAHLRGARARLRVARAAPQPGAGGVHPRSPGEPQVHRAPLCGDRGAHGAGRHPGRGARPAPAGGRCRRRARLGAAARREPVRDELGAQGQPGPSRSRRRAAPTPGAHGCEPLRRTRSLLPLRDRTALPESRRRLPRPGVAGPVPRVRRDAPGRRSLQRLWRAVRGDPGPLRRGDRAAAEPAHRRPDARDPRVGIRHRGGMVGAARATGLVDRAARAPLVRPATPGSLARDRSRGRDRLHDPGHRGRRPTPGVRGSTPVPGRPRRPAGAPSGDHPRARWTGHHAELRLHLAPAPAGCGLRVARPVEASRRLPSRPPLRERSGLRTSRRPPHRRARSPRG